MDQRILTFDVLDAHSQGVFDYYELLFGTEIEANEFRGV